MFIPIPNSSPTTLETLPATLRKTAEKYLKHSVLDVEQSKELEAAAAKHEDLASQIEALLAMRSLLTKHLLPLPHPATDVGGPIVTALFRREDFQALVDLRDSLGK